MIVDGKQIAAEILARTKKRAGALATPPRVVAIVANETLATLSYMKVKQRAAETAGCIFEVISVSASDLNVLMIRRSAQDKDSLIIQLPLPEGLDTKELCDAIPIEKDADVLSTAARKKGTLLPPVVAAVREIFERTKVKPLGKNAVVIGEGWLVGQPVAEWLRKQGAEVEVLNSKSRDRLTAALRAADIIVSGAGSPHLIKPEMLKEGVVLIDAATSESNGVIAGDADQACAEVASIFTPVPGGVGPIAVACLFANTVTLAERQS